LRAVFGGGKTFLHSLDPNQTLVQIWLSAIFLAAAGLVR
jgi:hypothetical protein